MSAWNDICSTCSQVKPCHCDALPLVSAGEPQRTIVVNKNRYRGGDAIDIGRPTIFGNPYKDGTRAENIARFQGYFRARVQFDRQFRSAVLTLRGKVLACSCKPNACHGDVIAEWLDNPQVK